MVINGRPGLACHTRTSDLPDHISLHPLPVFKLLGDLSVDTGTWFRQVGQKIESWVHTSKPFEPHAPEERMTNTLANEIFELDRCVECGCCVAACGTALMRNDFIGATSINRLARFYIDPRDERTSDSFYELIGDDSGVFGCMGLLAPAKMSAPREYRFRISWASCGAWPRWNPYAASCPAQSAKSF